MNTTTTRPRTLPLGSIESDFTLNTLVRTREGQRGTVTGFSEGGCVHVTLEASGLIIKELFWHLTILEEA